MAIFQPCMGGLSTFILETLSLVRWLSVFRGWTARIRVTNEHIASNQQSPGRCGLAQVMSIKKETRPEKKPHGCRIKSGMAV